MCYGNKISVSYAEQQSSILDRSPGSRNSFKLGFKATLGSA